MHTLLALTMQGVAHTRSSWPRSLLHDIVSRQSCDCLLAIKPVHGLEALSQHDGCIMACLLPVCTRNNHA